MWLETITVRTAEAQALHQALPQLIAQLAVAAPSIEIAVFSRHPVRSDVSLHLLHTTGRLARSLHGTQLAHSLRLFGTVNHSVWESIALNPCSE